MRDAKDPALTREQGADNNRPSDRELDKYQSGPAIVRSYEPAPDLNERLARIYAMLRVPPFPGE
jgi:hypothetical protein